VFGFVRNYQFLFSSKMCAKVINDSAYIQWQVIRKNSCFLSRQRGITKTFSTERFNPISTNSIRYNGLINKSGVDVQPNKDKKKGLLVVVKKKNLVSKPGRAANNIALDKDSSRILKTIKKLAEFNKPAHSKLCQRRASQILRSQKPFPKKKRNGDKAQST